MKSYLSLNTVDHGVPLLADDITEFHLARLLILFEEGCGGSIRGLTKLAKLDFFLRYPGFLEKITSSEEPAARPRESAMVRHLYGPWDHRYYTILNILVARGFMEYTKQGRAYAMTLTPQGREAADALAASREFKQLAQAAHTIGEALGRFSGTALKNMIYREFSEEVADIGLGDSIG